MVAELVPVFLVLCPAGIGVSRIEEDCAFFRDDDAFGRDDVPDVQGDDVGGEEVEVSSFIAAAGGADVAFVASFGAAVAGGFDLDADEAAVGFDDRVVTGGVSPGMENLEAVFGGGGDELEFGPFATALAVLDPDLDAFWGFHRGNKKRGREGRV